MSENRAGPSSNSTPARKRSSMASSTRPITRTRYSRSMALEGCISALARAPSVVNKRTPEVLKSSRPTETQRPCFSSGKRSKTVRRFSRSLREHTSRAGLWYSRTRTCSAPSHSTDLPSRRTDCPDRTRSPRRATVPSSVTRPASIQRSILRREPHPKLAKTF